LAIPSLGESWHHNHHAPRSAVHGLKRWEPDPSGLIIATMEKLGLARNVIRISPRAPSRTRVLLAEYLKYLFDFALRTVTVGVTLADSFSGNV
jgi:stearoyl-CoA desaturase (delta-9 desaturase)